MLTNERVGRVEILEKQWKSTKREAATAHMLAQGLQREAKLKKRLLNEDKVTPLKGDMAQQLG